MKKAPGNAWAIYSYLVAGASVEGMCLTPSLLKYFAECFPPEVRESAETAAGFLQVYAVYLDLSGPVISLLNIQYAC